MLHRIDSALTYYVCLLLWFAFGNHVRDSSVVERLPTILKVLVSIPAHTVGFWERATQVDFQPLFLMTEILRGPSERLCMLINYTDTEQKHFAMKTKRKPPNL